jgi:hypothetical protein
MNPALIRLIDSGNPVNFELAKTLAISIGDHHAAAQIDLRMRMGTCKAPDCGNLAVWRDNCGCCGFCRQHLNPARIFRAWHLEGQRIGWISPLGGIDCCANTVPF